MLDSNAVADSFVPADRTPALKVMVVAGEASGDQHTAGVVSNLLEMQPNAKVFGMGGSHLAKAGMELVVNSEHSASVMGFTEVVGSAGRIYRAFKTLLRTAEERRPDLVILVDFPDFNLRLAKALHKRGIKILYYISPQLWAWRKNRVKAIKRYVTKVIPIFPFEAAFYHQHGVDAEYLGHPFLDRAELDFDRNEFIKEIGLDPKLPIVAVLPGSRKSELEELLSPMLAAVQKLRAARPGIQAVIPVADTLDLEQIKSQVPDGQDIVLVKGRAREILSVATVGVLASGTATVEAALAGIPFVVAYRLSGLTYAIAKLLVKGVSNVAMVNLIAGKKVVEELLQEEVTGERIASELEILLGDTKRTNQMKKEFVVIREKLLSGTDKANGSSSERVAATAISIAGPSNLWADPGHL